MHPLRILDGQVSKNSKELADAIIKLKDDMNLSEHLAEKALKRLTIFEKDKVMEKYLQFLTEEIHS